MGMVSVVMGAVTRMCTHSIPMKYPTCAHRTFKALDLNNLCIQNGLLAAHHKLSKYYYWFDQSPFYIWVVMPQSSPEPWFVSELFQTGPRSSPKFGIRPELNLKSGSGFGRGPKGAEPHSDQTEPEPEGCMCD